MEDPRAVKRCLFLKQIGARVVFRFGRSSLEDGDRVRQDEDHCLYILSFRSLLLRQQQQQQQLRLPNLSEPPYLTMTTTNNIIFRHYLYRHCLCW